MPNQHVIEIWNKRRTFAARRHITFTEVRDHIDAKPFADNTRLAYLERTRDLFAEILSALAFVKNGLAMAPNQLDRVDWNFGAFGGFLQCFGIEFA